MVFFRAKVSFQTKSHHPNQIDQMSDKWNVLILCTGNSARSIMAEAILRHHGRDRFNAFSAGSKPTGIVNPLSLELLRKLDYDTDNLRSNSWDEFAGEDAPEIHFIITVCDSAAGETCPVWPGKPMIAHWGIDDPAAKEGSISVRMQAFQEAFAQLYRKIELFLNLPIDSLAKLVLQKKLDEIGESS